MVIIAISEGGLGNQMFQYAFYRAFKEKTENVKIDLRATWNTGGHIHNGYELNRIFKLNLDIANTKERISLLNKPNNILSKIKNKIYKKNTPTAYFCKNINEAITFNPTLFEMHNIYMYGYYQSEKYFKEIANIIRKDFTFSKPVDIINQKLINQIGNTESVSIHIRRGDYLNIPNTQNICNISYYKKAINFILKNISNPKFYIFSNDINWCKQHLQIDNAVFISNNIGKNSFIDMQLMSCCKHNIIANSTFSWWGAWLNNNPNKIIISPNKWMNDTNGTDDIIPNDWIKI